MDRFYQGPDSLFVRAYDAFYRDAPPQIAGDITFYRQLTLQTGGPILELACGPNCLAARRKWPGCDWRRDRSPPAYGKELIVIAVKSSRQAPISAA